MEKPYALFDLDHTLLPFDTQALFCNHVLRREGWRRIYLLWFCFCLPVALAGRRGVAWLKRLFLSFLWGMSRERLAEHVANFVEGDFLAALYPEVREELERHRSKGRVLVLNSASPEFYLAAVSEALDFDHFVGTVVETPERMPFLPRIAGGNNKHGAKIAAMRERGIVPEDAEAMPGSWAYSDSSADLPLLRFAEHGVMVHPGEALASAGRQAGWNTLRPPRPYRGKAGDLMASIRQACGLWPTTEPAGKPDS